MKHNVENALKYQHGKMTVPKISGEPGRTSKCSVNANNERLFSLEGPPARPRAEPAAHAVLGPAPTSGLLLTRVNGAEQLLPPHGRQLNPPASKEGWSRAGHTAPSAHRRAAGPGGAASAGRVAGEELGGAGALTEQGHQRS